MTGKNVIANGVNWWYEAIIDWMLLNPQKRLLDCAQDLDVTPSWLSTIIHTDSFKELFADRRDGLSAQVDQGIGGKLETLAQTTLEEIQRRVDEEREKLSFGQLESISGMALKSMGYGIAKAGAGVMPVPQVSVSIAVSPEGLADAREKMRTINGIGVEVSDVVRSTDKSKLLPASEGV